MVAGGLALGLPADVPRELVPFVDLVPSWTLAVMFATRGPKAPESPGAPPPPALPPSGQAPDSSGS
jgi:hypothetical protein